MKRCGSQDRARRPGVRWMRPQVGGNLAACAGPQGRDEPQAGRTPSRRRTGGCGGRRRRLRRTHAGRHGADMPPGFKNTRFRRPDPGVFRTRTGRSPTRFDGARTPHPGQNMGSLTVIFFFEPIHLDPGVSNDSHEYMSGSASLCMDMAATCAERVGRDAWTAEPRAGTAVRDTATAGSAADTRGRRSEGRGADGTTTQTCRRQPVPNSTKGGKGSATGRSDGDAADPYGSCKYGPLRAVTPKRS